MRGSILDRIWIRFGLYIAGTVLATMALLAAGAVAFSEVQYRDFYRSLPANVQHELDELNDQDLEDSPKAMAIYGQYWRGDLLFGEKWSLVVGLVICLPFGLTVGFLVSRFVTQPLASMAEAATRVATGDFTVRAEAGRTTGEMADMVAHFNQMTDALEYMAHERRAHAASISHELRTPLAVLRARLHAICDGVIEADAAESRVLLDQVEYMGRLVADLHTLSMVDAGQLAVELTQHDLADIVNDTLAGYASRMAEHEMTLDVELPPSPDTALVNVDPGRTRQILSNLLENALNHANGGGWIGVSVAVRNADVVLKVMDAGPGLPDSMLERPFRRFAHAAGERRGGSGLGLSIVQALTIRQGGQADVFNLPEGGTCFVIRFPLSTPDRADTADATG